MRHFDAVCHRNNHTLIAGPTDAVLQKKTKRTNYDQYAVLKKKRKPKGGEDGKAKMGRNYNTQ